jgi:hypothetical protein
MYTITNKELRHFKAVLRGAIEAYRGSAILTLKGCGCSRCMKVQKAKDFLATLEPNA